MQTTTLLDLMSSLELTGFETKEGLPLTQDPTYKQLRNIAELIAKERPIEKYVKNVEYKTVGHKTTVCLITDSSGFEIVGSSACVDPKEFDINIGMKWAYKDALDKLEEYHAYLRSHTELRRPRQERRGVNA